LDVVKAAREIQCHLGLKEYRAGSKCLNLLPTCLRLMIIKNGRIKSSQPRRVVPEKQCIAVGKPMATDGGERCESGREHCFALIFLWFVSFHQGKELPVNFLAP